MLLLKRWVHRVLAPLLALGAPMAANAGQAQNLPWEAPVTTLVNSLTGPIALGIALVAFSASGWALVWGGELPDWGRKMLLVVLVVAAILAAAGFIGVLFPGAGAVIALTMQDEELVRVPIRQSLIRPQHLAGAERELTLTVIMTSIALVFIALSWPAAIAGALIFVFGMQAARRMAKADPQMTKVYRRHVNYRAFYRARSGPKCQG